MNRFLLTLCICFLGCHLSASAVNPEYLDAGEIKNVENNTSINGWSFPLGNNYLYFEQGSGTIPPRYYVTGPSLRMYYGNNLYVTSYAQDVRIIQVRFIFYNNKQWESTPELNTGYYSQGVWEGATQELCITSNATVYIKRIEVTYEYFDPDEGGGNGDEDDDDLETDYPKGYYNGLEGLYGSELKEVVKTAARKNFKRIPYGSATNSNCTWKVFLESDTRMVDGVLCWWDMYSSGNVPAPAYNSHPNLNIEHSVANSWWDGSTEFDAYYDLFHLNPSDAESNTRKQNYPLGLVASFTDSSTWQDSGKFTTVGKPTPGTSGDATMVFEPADEYKGDFARAFFYIFTAYDDITWRQYSTNWMYDTSSPLTLKPWAYTMLLEWAKKDPVSQKEIDRNEVIYRQQGNRNPFIDLPDLPRHIWGDYRITPYSLKGHTDPVPVTENGWWEQVTASSQLSPNEKYILASATTNFGFSIYSPTYESPFYMLETYRNPELLIDGKTRKLSSIPEDMAVLSLEKTGSAWNVAVSDLQGVFRGYLCSNEAKKLYLTPSKTEQGTAVTITPSASSTNFLFPAGAGYLKYNANSNGRRFTTYTSGQENLILYRFVSDGSSDDTLFVDRLTTDAAISIAGDVVTTSGRGGIHVYNLAGQIVGQTSGNSIDIASLPYGIYVVRSGTAVAKFRK